MQAQLIDNVNRTLRDDLVMSIKSGSRVSIYAFQQLREQLNGFKGLLDRMSHLCRGKSETILELCRKLNAETRDGQRMGTYSHLLGDAVSSRIKVKESTDLFSFLDSDSSSLFGNEVRGLDDFEFICFLIIR